MFFTGLFAATFRPVRRRADSVVRARVTGPYLAIVQHVYGVTREFVSLAGTAGEGHSESLVVFVTAPFHCRLEHVAFPPPWRCSTHDCGSAVGPVHRSQVAL